MRPERPRSKPILITGAAGAIGSIGRNLTEMLVTKGHKVRALVRREDVRAVALRQLGAEVMQGGLTDLTAMHRAIEGCARIYFSMSVSADYLTATINTAAVARNHGVGAFVNMSQMTSWRAPWAAARPRLSPLSTLLVLFRSSSTIPRRTSVRFAI